MTGSQDLTAVQPPMASSHSPASTSSVSSNGSYGGYRASYHPSYPAHSAETDNMGTFPPGLQDWEEPNYPHPASYTTYESGPAYPGTNNTHEPSQQAGQPGQPPGMTVTMCQSGGSSENRTGQHTVHFHVHQGEAVSLQLGEQVQMIQGPATVRMVSTSHEPPVPLPVQVPAGHFVHQIVDENGVLQHVILSQHPSIYPNLPPAPNGTQPGWQGGSGSYHDPATGAPPPTIQCQGPPPTPYWNNNRMEGETRPSKSNKNKNRGDHERRYKNGKPSGSSSPSLSVQSTPPQSPVKPRGHGGYNGRSSGGWKGSNVTVDDSDESGIGINNDEDQEEKGLLLEILSNIRTPTVPEIRARSALLVWSPPACEPEDPKFEGVKPIPESDLEYEVLMSDKGRDGKYRSIFSGASKDCYLTDLRPHTEYHIRVHAVLKSLNLKGGASDTVSFVTLACEPDQPAQPKLVTRSKTSIQLKWNSPHDNGAHIQHFLLESDVGATCVGHFATIYEGRAKSFNVQKLTPSTPYKFRLIAVNELGKSRPSEITSFTTQGSAPSQPQPPDYVEAETTESSMRLQWQKRPCDDEFTLQMDDVNAGHGFLPQYNGPEVEHVVRGLKRNTSYRFKLRAHNEMGASQYSGIVSYTTRPARPQPPAKPQVKGKVRPHTFKIFWSCPADNGGTPITCYHLEVDAGSGWVSVYSGPDLEYVCDKLEPGTQYRLRVAAESQGGSSEFSETCFVTTEPVAPGPPHPPQLRDKPKSNSLHLSWAAPENDGGASITEFDIDMTSPDNTTRSVYRGRDTECVVASLMPGRPYLFQVRAQNRAGPGAWSEPLEVISGAGPPDRPKEPRAAAKSGSTASVAWEQPINNGAIISSYRLELAQVSLTPDLLDSDSEDEEEEEGVDDEEGVKENVSALDEEDGDQSDDESVYDDESEVSEDEEICSPGGEEKTICDNQVSSVSPPVTETVPTYKELVWQLAYSGSANQTELTSLVPATQYQLRLCAINSAGVSPYSCNVSMVTPASAPACPRHLVLHTSTSYTMLVKWKRPAEHGEPVLRYWVEWSKAGGEESSSSSVMTERRRVNLTDLRPDTHHYVRVQAENAMGRGPFTPWLKVSTRPLPPAPPRLECQNVSHNQLKLRWGDAKTSQGTNYVVEMENHRRQWQQLYSGNNISFKVNKLLENTEYRVRICAISPAGQGPYSTVYTFKTSFAPPPSLKTAARVSGLTESECLVAWSSLKTNSPDLMQYRVQLTRVKDQHVTTYEAGTDLELRIAGLEAKSDYTVRVCGVRLVDSCGQTSQLVGTFSPSTQLTTKGRTSSTAATPATSRAETVRNTGSVAPTWTDQQWAVIILCGFTLFSIIIAMVIQQVISWGTVSS